MKTLTRMLPAVLLATGLGGAADAAELTNATAGDARTKVETAVALANIATAEKDGDALLVAARMLAMAGPVARQGESGDKPALYDVGALAASAREMGADPAKADEVARMATAPTASPRDGYWYYSCDSFNNCQWIWVGW